MEKVPYTTVDEQTRALRQEVGEMAQAAHNAGFGFMRTTAGVLVMVPLDRPGQRTDKDDDK